MVEEGEDTPMRSEPDHELDQEPEEDGSSDSGTEDGSETEEQEEQIEWLATSRQKRSTAGNRMSTMVQQEESDDDLELLFAEADDDAVFEDAEVDQSDVQMDSSSDDDDQGPQAGADDLDGEMELQKQNKAEKKKRRKLNNGIPKIYKRKVKIDSSARASPAPRPKKKSERSSWIPTLEDAPTRASARGTTKQRNQELMEQMRERESKRLKQLQNMAKAAAAKEAAKKPPMTQADRLREAAKVERSNTKSLSKWEEMEQQREEEQRERLAALHNRTLEGPVITWWSGLAEWVGGKLKKVGQIEVTAQEPKERLPKKRKAADMEAAVADSSDTIVVAVGKSATQPTTDRQQPLVAKDTAGPQFSTPTPIQSVSPALDLKPNLKEPSPILAPPPIIAPPPTLSSEPLRVSSVLAPPPMHGPYPPPPEPGFHRPSSFLAPPPMTGPPALTGIPATGIPSMPMLAPGAHPAFKLAPPPQPSFDGSAPLPGFGYNFMASNQTLYPQLQPPLAPSGPPPPLEIDHAAMTYLILSSFNEDAIRDRDVQTQILMNRKFHKLPRIKPPTELCAITSYPAKYRDPQTGLTYCNSYAYKEIQKLKRGEYKWSLLVGAYVGSCGYAARGVPVGFVDEKAREKKIPVLEQKEKEIPIQTS